MKIIVAGGDGFCGWPTSLYLSKRGFDVAIIDNLVRREIDVELNSNSLTPIAPLEERVAKWKELTGREIEVFIGDLNDYEFLSDVFQSFKPEAFVHFAEQRSAPYSMISRSHAYYTQSNNVLGNINVLYAIKDFNPDCHLVKLGTMGEYGTPNIDIEEGYLEIEYKGGSEKFLYPKRAGSFYHLTKVHDTNNIDFAVRAWGIRATDLNQGVVYAINTKDTKMDPILANRFDYDGIYGTVLNRFIVQAAKGIPMSVYGKGGQTRGFINIEDTVRCIELAALNPPERGEFKIYNQITEQFSVMDLAKKVQEVAKKYFEIETEIEQIENPRVEKEEHYYNAICTELRDLGLEPHFLTEEVIKDILELAIEHMDRVVEENVMNSPSWR